MSPVTQTIKFVQQILYIPLRGILREFKGFNDEQEAKLRDKKRKRGESNEEKWKDIFSILFPDAKEIPSPYYKSPDGTAESCDMKYGFINNLFENPDPVSERIARLRIEKKTGSLSEEAWREVKDTMREHFLATATTLRKPIKGNTNTQYPKPARSRDSQMVYYSSSTSSTSHEVPDAKRITGPSNGGNPDHKDHQAPELMGDCLFEAQDNGREPDIEDLSPGKSIDAWLSGVGSMFEWSIRPSRPSQPSQPSQPKPSPPSPPNAQKAPSPPSADEATFGPESSLPTKRAPEDGLDPNQEATAEICEERVFNNLNLTPEECLAAALEQKTPKWQGSEAESSSD
ncbi:hypothetical protein CGCS363_v011894 [Colletotrichum siamense]|uniref:uncharacterized protein n=1 Tax=Colletotrichum siamense TaxID=690259 RepID=UPI001872C3D6|nr:uncharacterized protein CGCS363_v011894 [Colletotrichum siamense]KAF5489182.1 hypothetical protein CGCS363_v011894 [Colletotrichum siamense]